MKLQSKSELYNACWEAWGADAQIDILIEEMAELTQSLLKARRNGTVFTSDVFEEIADVIICIEQSKDILAGAGLWHHVVSAKVAKLRRLQERYQNWKVLHGEQ